MIKSKKQMFLVIGVFALMLFVGGVTYAFFNYTRTGAGNTIRVGRIAFITRQTKTISLTNLFPIDPTDTEAMADETKVGTVEIEIEGDTDYVDGVEYLVSSENTNIYTSTGKLVPISLDVEITNLGTSSNNYFVSREDKNATIYKKLVGDELVGDQMLLVGYIKPNTTTGTAEGVNGKLTIKAYLDKNKILISDTYDGTESDNMGTPNSMAQGKTVLTTTEWNSLQATPITFQVKVEANEGIWVKGSLEEIMKQENFDTTKNRLILDNEQSEFVSASTGINFGEISSDTNGKGVYMRAGTENDAYPIIYYRGAVDNNNVMFNDKCWKAVRTTDMGGVKLIYNGEKTPVYSQELIDPDTYANEHEKDIFTFDSTDSTLNYEVNDGRNHEIAFKVPAGENYDMVISGTTGSSCGLSFNVLKDGNQVGGNGGGGGGAAISYTQTYGTLTSSNVLKVSIYGAGSTSSSCSVNLKINMQQGTTKLSKNDYSMLVEKASGYGCQNTGTNTQITLNGTGSFPFSGTNLYTSPAYNGYMYGTVYEISTDNWTSGARFGSSFTWDGTNYTLVDDSVTTPNDTHHYSCNSTDAEATCTSIRYVYWMSGGTKYYITISDGKGIEEAIKDMQTNTTPSNAKTQIDAWYLSNMNTVTSKLEDTIWCNDRSIGRYNGWSATGTINGFAAESYLLFGARERSNYASGTSTVINQPSLVCANKNDAFTVNNGNGNQKLTYPVALLTEDEMVLAGGLAGGESQFYLNNGNYYWSLSPSSFYSYSALGFIGGNLGNDSVADSYGLRPVVSLKPGTPVISGDGTATSPYRIG